MIKGSKISKPGEKSTGNKSNNLIKSRRIRKPGEKSTGKKKKPGNYSNLGTSKPREDSTFNIIKKERQN